MVDEKMGNHSECINIIENALSFRFSKRSQSRRLTRLKARLARTTAGVTVEVSKNVLILGIVYTYLYINLPCIPLSIQRLAAARKKTREKIRVFPNLFQ